MELLTFLSNNWFPLSALATFLFTFGYTYSNFKQGEKELGKLEASFKNALTQQYRDVEADLKEQKRDHDEKIATLQKDLSSTVARVDALKDNVFESIKNIELSIREIMTILKNNSTK